MHQNLQRNAMKGMLKKIDLGLHKKLIFIRHPSAVHCKLSWQHTILSVTPPLPLMRLTLTVKP